ncbi:HEPN domain-containing protein [Patescibacteria group bacterium]|nr:HEPN domain-containing protein [Patescibacteria group bacterium]
MPEVKIIPESNWRNYLIKARQFLETAQDTYLKENWNAVGLNAVHSAISANDALIVYYGKVRSTSKKHSDAAELLLRIFKNSEESKQNSKHLLWLINRKNLVEYEERLFFKKEAEESLKHAERFLNWAKSKLPKD